MGLATFATGVTYASASGQIDGLTTNTDLCVVVRMKIDALRNLTGFFQASLFQQDNGSAPNTTWNWRMYCADNGGPKRIQLQIFNEGGIDTGWIPLTSWPAAGSYIVAVLWHTQSNFQAGFSIYIGKSARARAVDLPRHEESQCHDAALRG